MRAFPGTLAGDIKEKRYFLFFFDGVLSWCDVGLELLVTFLLLGLVCLTMMPPPMEAELRVREKDS